MNANLSPENEQFLDHAVLVGMYHNRDEALDRAVELLRRREQLICDVNAGIEQLERGEGMPLDIDNIKSIVHSHAETS
jgi:Arc/MetJ-type ribon-helix-helix transcriptional regulator